MDNLKPCPFCGGNAQITDPEWEDIHRYTAYVAVHCTVCGVKGHTISFPIRHNCGGIGSEWRSPYEAQAISGWNNRPTEATARAEALKDAAERADTYMTSHAADAGFWDVNTLCKIILADKQEPPR